MVLVPVVETNHEVSAFVPSVYSRHTPTLPRYLYHS